MEKESKTYRIYDKTIKQWYEIPEDQYREYDRWRTALRKRIQYRGECFCPRSKWCLCDGSCLDCEFYISPTESLDAPFLVMMVLRMPPSWTSFQILEPFQKNLWPIAICWNIFAPG